MKCDPSTKPHNIVEKVSHFPENTKQISTPGFTGVPERTTLVPYAKFPNTLPISISSSTARTKQLLLATINARKSTARSTLDPPIKNVMQLQRLRIKKDDHLTADQYVNVDQPIKIKNVTETEFGQFETVITPASMPETEVCRHSSLCPETVFTECEKTTLKIADPMDIECDKSNNKHDKAMVESEVCLPGSKNVNMFDTKRVEHCVPLQNILSRKKNSLPASITRKGQLSVQTQPQSQILVQVQPEGQPFVQTPLKVNYQCKHSLNITYHCKINLKVNYQCKHNL
ncbi:unnamed protein product [Mytilus edulis]|uniref:Uncharacterized protein n=1 Tax=Mytilus edulis TaxID=6550 RepID=A0A8S3SBG5_MYTED|nr:unnamed protein product [Mytilus edulis]